MSEQEKNDLYYVCSLIEYLGRVTNNHRSTIVKILGKEEVERELKLAPVNHCLTFEQVADELIEYFHIKTGDFDSVGNCKYTVPGYLAIGNIALVLKIC